MNIQIPQILFQIINFGVVAAALTYLLYKPILKMLKDRSDKVEAGQKAAEVSIAELHEMDNIKKKIVKDSEKEAAKLMEEASAAASARKEELMAKAQKEAAAEVEKMKMAWEDERRAIITDVKKEFNNAVFATVEKIMGSMDKKAHMKLIDDELEGLLEKI